MSEHIEKLEHTIKGLEEYIASAKPNDQYIDYYRDMLNEVNIELEQVSLKYLKQLNGFK